MFQLVVEPNTTLPTETELEQLNTVPDAVEEEADTSLQTDEGKSPETRPAKKRKIVLDEDWNSADFLR